MRHLSAGFGIARRTLPSLALWLVSQALGGAAGLGPALAQGQPVAAAESALQRVHPPLTRVAFAELLVHFQRRSFADEQLALVRAAVHGGDYFTCEQAAQLMRASAFASDRGKIAATLYPRLVDPENWTQLVAALPREDDRRALRLLVGP